MNRGERDGALTAFGVATCVYWLTRAVLPYPIPPLVAIPDLSGLLREISPWIREMAPQLRRPDAEIIASLRRESLFLLAQAWTLIALGVTAGLLITRRRSAGAWIAVALSSLLLLAFARQQWTFVSQTGTDFWRYWPMLLDRHPRLLIRVVLDVSFSTFSVFFLLRRSVRQRFRAAPAAAAPGSPS